VKENNVRLLPKHKAAPFKREIVAYLQRTQFLGHSTSTDNKDLLKMCGDITAAFTPYTEPGDYT